MWGITETQKEFFSATVKLFLNLFRSFLTQSKHILAPGPLKTTTGLINAVYVDLLDCDSVLPTFAFVSDYYNFSF